ncbi:MAG: antitoxin component YwqK of YwqJK toxin-antitoxin module [Candidatus Latescibacterota bacterium]
MHEDGSVEIAGVYARGQKDSTWSFFDATGSKTLVHSWREGQRWNGPYIESYENGERKLTGTYYRRGPTHGASSIYWDDGALRKTGINSVGKKQRPWQTFTRSGTLSIVATYSQGLLTGSYTSY